MGPIARLTLRLAAILAIFAAVSADDSTSARTRTVSVSGRVLFNGRPLPDVLLRFQHEAPRESVPASVTFARSDDAGRYLAQLPEWGSYVVSGTFDERSLPRQQVSFQSSEHDIVYQGAALEVTLTGLEDNATAKVVVRAGSYAQEATLRYPHKRRILPLPPLSYTIVAYDVAGRVSREVRAVTFDAAHLEAAVELDLAPNPAELTIRDETGRPVSRLAVNPWGGTVIPVRIPEVEPGRYRLAGVPAGVELHIRPVDDWMPVCRKAPFGGRLDVVLTRGRRAEVSFTRLGVVGPVGTLSGVEGSDCPVPFNFFRMDRLAIGPDETPRGIIRNFPVSKDLLFEFRGLPQYVTVNGDGSVIVR